MVDVQVLCGVEGRTRPTVLTGCAVLEGGRYWEQAWTSDGQPWTFEYNN